MCKTITFILILSILCQAQGARSTKLQVTASRQQGDDATSGGAGDSSASVADDELRDESQLRARLALPEYQAAKQNTHQFDPIIVCYLGSWSVYRPSLAKFTPENINPFLCTHIIYAFAGLSSKFELKPFDSYNDITQGGYRKFTSLKEHNKQLKTLIAVGGWNEGSARFSKLVASPELRANFIQSTIRFLREHKFDGLDLDWEYPGFRDGSSADDKERYATLIKELRAAFDKDKERHPNSQRLLLSVAVPAGQDNIDNGFDVPTISRNVDFMNVLTYDYYTAFDKQTNHHAPLTIRPGQQVDESNKRLNIDWTINYYLSLGAAPSKLIVGVPTYGRSYTLSSSLGLDQAQLSGDEEATDIADKIGLGARADGPGEEGSATREKGYLAYYEICQRIDNEQWVKQKFASDHQGPLAYRANQWVSYDDVESVIMKTQYVIKKRLGGVMVWTLDNDDFRGSCPSSQHNENPLITAIRDTIIKSVQTVAPKWQATTTTTSTTTTTTTTSTTTTTPMPAIDSTDDGNELSVSGSSESASASDVGTSLIRSLATQASNRPAPTTPDPGPAFTCKDEGFFPNPKDCRKYFWCLDSGPANLGVVAHAFTCPSGLFFNSQTEGCDYPEKVSCRIKSSTTTKAPSRTERPTTTMSSTSSTSTTGKPALSGLSAERNRMVVKKNRKPSSTSTTTTTTTTTTSTTTPAPPTTTLAAIAATNDINELVASMLQNPQFASVINNQLKLSQQQQQAQRQAAASQADEAGASDQSGAAGEPSPVSEEFGSSLAGAANSKQAKDLLQLLNLIQSLGGVDKIAPYLANQTLAASGSGASLAEPLAELDEQMGSPAAPSRQRRPQVQLDVGGGGGTEPASNNREPFVFSYGQPSVAGGQRLSTQNGIMANDNDQENGQPVGSNGVAAQLTPEIMNNLAQLESLFAYNQPGRTAAGQQTVGASEASTSRQPLVESQPFTLDDARFTPIQTGRQVQQAAGLGDPLIRVQVPGAHQHRQQQVQQQQQQAEQLARQSAARDRQPAPRQQQQFNDIAGFLPYLEGDVRQPVATRAHQHFSDQSGGLLVDHSPTGARKATTGNRLAAQAADQRRPVAAMTQQPRLGAGQVQPRAQAQVQAQQPQQQRRRPPNRERGQRANAIDFPPAGEQSSALEEQQRPRSLVLLTAGPPTFNRALEANADATSSSSADSLTDRTLEDRLRMLENGYYSTTSLPEPADSSDAPPSSSTAISSIRRDLPTGRLRTDQEPDSAAPDTSQPTSPADDEPIAPSARTDQSGPGALVDQQTGSLVCTRRGVFAHPNSCGQFIVCAPQSRSQRSLRPFEHHCPAEHIFHDSWGRCRPKSLQSDLSKLCVS